MSSNESKVAVVIPAYKARPDPDEEISLRHVETVLGRYQRFFMTPEGLGWKRPGFEVLELAPEHFRSIASYSRLLLSAAFYEHFTSYSHILIYQLDSLVFRDELETWCLAGYDYIGAPWFRSLGGPRPDLSRTGNGGFSLRRVAACLAVLRSERYAAHGPPLWRELLTARLPDLDSVPWPRRWLKKLKVLRKARRGAGWYSAHYTLNEDRFWADRAHLFYPQFRVAPAEVALRFAFESRPRDAYERCGRQLPFGCHAWRRWDHDFWKPHLMQPHPVANSPEARRHP